MESMRYLQTYSNQWNAATSSYEDYKTAVSVKLNPTEQELADLSWLLNAVDLLVRFNCFTNQNPMKVSHDERLDKPWQWAIIQVGEIIFPAPINLHAQSSSLLFSYCDEAVLLGHEDCAITTAVFYLNQLIQISFEWEEFSRYCHPIYIATIRAGLDELNYAGEQRLLDALEMLKDRLGSAGWKVLN